MQRLLAMAAGRRFAVVDGVGVIDEGALDLGVSELTARFVVGRRLGWGAFQGRRVGRGRLGGIGGVLVEALLEFSDLRAEFLKALLIPLNKSQDGHLGSGRYLIPQFNRDRRKGRHTSILRPLEGRTSSADSADERVPRRGSCGGWVRGTTASRRIWGLACRRI